MNTSENAMTEENDDISDLIAELQGLDDGDDTIFEETPDTDDDSDTIVEAQPEEEAEVDIADLESDLTRAEVYADHEGDGAAIETVDKDQLEAAAKSKKAPKARKNAAPAKPKDLSSIDASAFVLDNTQKADCNGEADKLEANKQAVIATMPKQVKIAEKFENLFASIATGRAPSKYVTLAYERLKANGGTMTNTDLIAFYKASGLGDGTARSQSGQIMTLFDAVKIATRSGQTLKLNPDSLIAPYLDSKISA